ncbi:hypothetical protein TrST_g2291 [Triparma strigata]|uniref:RING-type domain-containing protein n=1 Tax=Triparma strigata TaxID=1606541 RepID=A0A9W7ABD8_9STRA|nr:hypothetical protein TrST_g2291 [Triparma strigata]
MSAFYNPVSKYEEQVEFDGVTLFELHGPPRAPVVDSSTTTLPIKSVQNITQCPVCLMSLKKTHIVMECLHRFCGECIEKSIRVGKKECPSCRLHLPSRRSLRADPNFDALLVAMLGDVNALDEEEAKETEAQNRELNFNNALTKSQQVGIQQQNINRKKVKISTPRANQYSSQRSPSSYAVHRPSQPNQYSRTTSAPSSSSKRPSSDSASHNAKRRMEASQKNLISFVLRRHPRETGVARLDREYIRTSSELKIIHLKKFLGIKLGFERFEEFQIIIMAEGKGVILDESLTLDNIRNSILDSRSGEFVLHFKT